MSDSLETLINDFNTDLQSRDPKLADIITRIIKQSESDETMAYYLGRLFRQNPRLTNGSYSSTDRLIQRLHTDFKKSYFDSTDRFDRHSWINPILMLFGTFGIAAGILQMTNQTITFGAMTQYLVFQVRGGGYKLVFGAVFLSIGILREVDRAKKNRLLRKIESINSN